MTGRTHPAGQGRSAFFCLALAGDGEYLLTGNPGDVFQLRFDRHPERPIYDTATIGEATQPPPDVPDYADLESVSKSSADALNDPPTRTAMAGSLDAVLTSLEAVDGISLASCVEAVRTTINDVLANRSGASRGVDWYGGWRVPVNQAMDSHEITTAEEYLAAMRAIEGGL